jgi:hypothetical protein
MMLQQFRVTQTFGQVTMLHDSPSSEEVFIDMHLYLKCNALPISLGRFNSCTPPGKMIVQTNLVIESCSLSDIQGTSMLIHMDKHDRLTEGTLNVYFIDSICEPNTLHLLIKSSDHHIRSSSDLFHGDNTGFVSQPELHHSHIVKVADCVCKKICRVVASQPSTNCVHVYMVPNVWMMIMGHLKEKTNDMSLSIYHDHDSKVRTAKRGVFVMSDKHIQLATIERNIRAS